MLHIEENTNRTNRYQMNVAFVKTKVRKTVFIVSLKPETKRQAPLFFIFLQFISFTYRPFTESKKCTGENTFFHKKTQARKFNTWKPHYQK